MHSENFQNSFKFGVDRHRHRILPDVRSKVDRLIRVDFANFIQDLLSSVLSRVDVDIELFPVDDLLYRSQWDSIVSVKVVVEVEWRSGLVGVDC